MKLSERMSTVADKWQEKKYHPEVSGGLRGYSAEVAHLEAELESVKASDKDAWYWVDKTCELLECGGEGVFAIKSKIERLKASASRDTTD